METEDLQDLPRGVAHGDSLTFEALIASIQALDSQLRTQAARAVSLSLTLRNWCFGLYIAEFELRGADRARYGEHLLDELSRELKRLGISNVGRRQLYQYLTFYRAYPQIVRTASAQSRGLVSGPSPSLDAIVRTVSAQSALSPDALWNRLSYSHFELLIGLEDDLRRSFYQAEAIRGQWSVRELRRQIGSLLFERTGLSTDKEKLAELVRQGGETRTPALAIRDPYIFEFLGIKAREVMGESDLEDALLDRVQEFLLELGRGFCFEARQKRISIGGESFFIDLVFYHRILKCHVLIELKAGEFRHEHLGQLNTYVNWFRKHEMADGDNPPVGLLLCTRKNHALIEYALAGMDSRLFVSRYQVELPKKEELKQFLEMELQEQGAI
ncbi:MAG TPA: PDDEXK nuclease domain-containing protein [Thermoanaerobaculia bacterium]|jgi:predicted nuclease of restriction endonuclease-like (RecB) superfamily|nr:PDDEXK nuclease domain-containing protein [Thermoanaerobaculia bacterium]